MTSPDGINWTLRSTPTTNQWGSVAWSPQLGLFAAVSVTGIGNRVMTSPDGITWTSRTSAADNNWRDVTWSAENALFVAVSINGAPNQVMTSPDGITWTLQATPSDSWVSLAYAPALGRFAAISNVIASPGTGVMTSDGTPGGGGGGLDDVIGITGATSTSGDQTSITGLPHQEEDAMAGTVFELLGVISIPNTQTTSGVVQVPPGAGAVTILSPAALTNTDVVVDVEPTTTGTAFVTLQSSGLDVKIAAGKMLVIRPATFAQLRLRGASAEAAQRDFKVYLLRQS